MDACVSELWTGWAPPEPWCWDEQRSSITHMSHVKLQSCFGQIFATNFDLSK